MEATFNDVAPVVPVRNLQVALERYRKLGFAVSAYGHGTGYGYAKRDGVEIHISEWDEHDPKRTASVVYLFVSDADAVRHQWVAAGVEGGSARCSTPNGESASSRTRIPTGRCTASARRCRKTAPLARGAVPARPSGGRSRRAAARSARMMHSWVAAVGPGIG